MIINKRAKGKYEVYRNGEQVYFDDLSNRELKILINIARRKQEKVQYNDIKKIKVKRVSS